MTEIKPLPGDFCCCSTGGEAGRLVSLGERLNGDSFTRYDHTFIYVGDGRIVEAQPGGAREAPLGGYRDALWSTGHIPLTGEQRTVIVRAARSYIGVPYSWADYFALAAHRLRIPAPGLRRYIAATGHMICSQLVDRSFNDAAVHLFADGRWTGYCTPAALAGLLDN